MKGRFSLNLKLPKQTPLMKTVSTSSPKPKQQQQNHPLSFATQEQVHQYTAECDMPQDEQPCATWVQRTGNHFSPGGAKRASWKLTSKPGPARWTMFWRPGLDRREHSRQEGIYVYNHQTRQHCMWVLGSCAGPICTLSPPLRQATLDKLLNFLKTHFSSL